MKCREYTGIHRCMDCGWESMDSCATKTEAMDRTNCIHVCRNCRGLDFIHVLVRGRMTTSEARGLILATFAEK